VATTVGPLRKRWSHRDPFEQRLPAMFMLVESIDAKQA
jgi:hypothetical protein